MNSPPVSDHAFTWCVANLPVELVRLGCERRELMAIDTSTIVRLRAGTRLAFAAKGFCHRAGRVMRVNIVAATTSIVRIGRVREGIVRRTRFGARYREHRISLARLTGSLLQAIAAATGPLAMGP
jgi:hypothetical protein